MVMSIVISATIILSFVCGIWTNRLASVASAALSGAQSAFTLVLAMGGVLCLWSGVLEILRRCGALRALSRALGPILRRLLPNAGRDSETLSALSANVSANLLGLGNAATPPGLRAVERMSRGCGGTADDELCRLVVLNSASIQLLPATVAAVRAAAGCASPFDILPAVWVTSAISVTAGLLACKIFSRLWRDRA